MEKHILLYKKLFQYFFEGQWERLDWLGSGYAVTAPLLIFFPELFVEMIGLWGFYCVVQPMHFPYIFYDFVNFACLIKRKVQAIYTVDQSFQNSAIEIAADVFQFKSF